MFGMLKLHIYWFYVRCLPAFWITGAEWISVHRNKAQTST